MSSLQYQNICGHILLFPLFSHCRSCINFSPLSKYKYAPLYDLNLQHRSLTTLPFSDVLFWDPNLLGVRLNIFLSISAWWGMKPPLALWQSHIFGWLRYVLGLRWIWENKIKNIYKVRTCINILHNVSWSCVLPIRYQSRLNMKHPWFSVADCSPRPWWCDGSCVRGFYVTISRQFHNHQGFVNYANQSTPFVRLIQWMMLRAGLYLLLAFLGHGKRKAFDNFLNCQNISFLLPGQNGDYSNEHCMPLIERVISINRSSLKNE